MRKILYIGNKLSKHGFSVTNIETLGEQLINMGYEVYFASEYKNKLLRLFDMLFSIIRLSNKVNFVLIDVYSKQAFYFALLSAWVCRIFKMQYFPILHGGNLPFRLKKNPVLCKSIFGKSSINIAPSNYFFNVFSEAGYDVMFIPNNIFLENYKFRERKTFSPYLLWVRSFDKIYNPTMAIKVLKELLTKYPNAHLCMVGPDKDGSKKKCLEQAGEMGVQKNVTFTGWMSKADWHSLAEKYDFFINTTHVDNTPVSVIEAMALGLPVVTTDVGGISYLVENEKEGILVSRGNVKQMASAILKIIDNSETGQVLASNARRKAETFDWAVVRHQWKQLFENSN
ncbi:glycosyltransferase family 4 protein [Marinilabilia salmonicolor]|uniref:glycosyltransferase family 4 protein n=1 Tax=Marinilabilia salmonicolor TaxID=989 RepID=UPI000317D4AD|nr:glycosyltransferase family 4 protein [Marinilabilia salmonicolor]